MFQKVSVLIPYKPDHGVRDQLLQWVRQYYINTFSGIEVCVGIHEEELFNRSKAINTAAKLATRDIFVISDGDIFYHPSLLIDSMELIEKGKWVVPFRKIANLSEASTYKLLQTTPQWSQEHETPDAKITRIRNKGFVGRLNVISRSSFMRVGGFDERFAGWGGEDNSFCDAVDTLCSKHKRLPHTIYHLWHPILNYSLNPNSANNLTLRNLYYQAKGDKKKMKKLISHS